MGAQKGGTRSLWVPTCNHSSADENIDFSVAIIITEGYRTCTTCGMKK